MQLTYPPPLPPFPAEKLTSQADAAKQAKNLALSTSLRAKAHTLWMQERQALDEVSKDREMVKTEQAAEAAAESSAEQLAARIDKRIAAVDAEVWESGGFSEGKRSNHCREKEMKRDAPCACGFIRF